MIEHSKPDLAFVRLTQAVEALQDAQILLDYGGSARSVINRSFYAAFYAVHGLLESANVPAHKPAAVVKAFDDVFAMPGLFSREISRALHTLFDACQECDHTITRKASREEAESSVMLAERVVRAVDAFR